MGLARLSVVVVVVVVAGAGCKKEQQVTPAKGSGSAAPSVSDAAAARSDAAVASDAAVGGAVELLHAVPATVRVSSRVNNPKILPEHIVDRSFDTAWNSRTGDLVGAWVEVSVDDAQIEQVKLTVGHTGHGKKGEDYFTMNPRIAEVSVTDDGKPLGTFPMDVDNRGLQTIAEKPAGTLRITVTKIVSGSKKNWREIAISELEVWGTLAPGVVATHSDPLVEVDGAPTGAPDPCADIEAARVAFGDPHRLDTDGPGGDDHNYPPTCAELPLPANASNLSAPWSSLAGGCPIADEIYGPKDCVLSFRSGNRVASIEAPPGTMSSSFIAVTAISPSGPEPPPGPGTSRCISSATARSACSCARPHRASAAPVHST